MPASMISAPTGGRPKVIGSSIATVAMVPIPGSTPTSVPTSAPIRHSSRLIGEKATPKPRARLEKRSAITSSLRQETRKQLKRQPQRIGEQQTAADGQANSDDDGFSPPRLRRAQRSDHEACKGRDHKAQRTNRQRERQYRKRDEQRPPTGVCCQRRALGIHRVHHHGEPEPQQKD